MIIVNVDYIMLYFQDTVLVVERNQFMKGNTSITMHTAKENALITTDQSMRVTLKTVRETVTVDLLTQTAMAMKECGRRECSMEKEFFHALMDYPMKVIW